MRFASLRRRHQKEYSKLKAEAWGQGPGGDLYGRGGLGPAGSLILAHIDEASLLQDFFFVAPGSADRTYRRPCTATSPMVPMVAERSDPAPRHRCHRYHRLLGMPSPCWCYTRVPVLSRRYVTRARRRARRRPWGSRSAGATQRGGVLPSDRDPGPRARRRKRSRHRGSFRVT